MNDKTLFEKQQATKEKFDAAVVDKANKEKELEDLVIEMNRLQGEYRAFGALRDELKVAGAATTSAKQADPAKTIIAEAEVIPEPVLEPRRGKK